MIVIGLMSGTSMDAIDAAVVDIDPALVQKRAPQSVAHEGKPFVALRAFVEVPYPAQTREALEHLLSESSAQTPLSLAQLASLNVAIGEAFAVAAQAARKECGDRIELIGSHGQTVYHGPRPPSGTQLSPATLQLGEPAIIAARTGITCVADFRVADVAAGGQGAPLVSYVDHLLLMHPVEFRVALNIGGIANVTLLPPGAKQEDVTAFDCGPGNMPIDIAMRLRFPDGPGFDRNGQTAARGVANPELLAWLLQDGYLHVSPPKTAGREQFGPSFVERAWQRAQALVCSDDDFIATLTELSARSIASSVPAHCKRVIVSGGGVHNKTLMRILQRELDARPSPPAVVTSEAFGLPPGAKEAMAFAILGVATLFGRAGNLPHATGAKTSAVLGKIVPGANFSGLMASIWSDNP